MLIFCVSEFVFKVADSLMSVAEMFHSFHDVVNIIYLFIGTETFI